MRHHDDSHDDKLNHMRLWDIVVIAGFWTLYKKALSYQRDEARHGRHLRK